MTIVVQFWGPIVVGLFAAVSIVVGAHLALSPARNMEHGRGVTRVFAFGTGAFFSAVCLDFLPDAWSGNGAQTPLWIFLGALVMWLATNASDGMWQREERQQSQGAETATEASSIIGSALTFTPVSAVVLAIALSFHTFLEGVAVALSFHPLTFNTLGFSLAMILHKLPEGVLWGLALAAVFPRDRTRVRTMLIIPAVCTLIGVMLGIDLAGHASSAVVRIATGFVAGAMFYIAFAELLPALREAAYLRTARLWFLFGLVVMFMLNMAGNVFGQ
ncbi:MAG: ZIP family metal transporter [Firmicutes bacterium]|nr:ZIP family metal transporter [Bacillota bacterium]